jgi:hypothetical protein
MKNEAKRTESVRKGAMPCPSIRGHGIRKREVPFLKHVYEVGMRKYGKTNRR